jgi:hypothetical protein
MTWFKLGSFGAAALLACLGFAQTVKNASLETLERTFEDRIKKSPGPYPYDLMSNPSAVYIPGAGLTVTCRLNLVYATLESPFRPSPPGPAEYAALKQHKIDKIPVLEKTMQDYLLDTAGLPDLDAVRPTEQLAIGVTLFYYPKEDSTGLPRRIVMSAEKQKLLQARRDKLDLATVIQEQKL